MGIRMLQKYLIDNNADGVGELAGKDIATSVVGSYVVTFNDSTKAYSLEAQ